MSPLASACLLALGLGAVLAAPAGYTTKFDNVDVDRVLANERLLAAYYNCLMDRGRCTPEGDELKRDIPDALKTACSKCSAKQRAGTDKVIRFLIDKRPKLYHDFERKYDPKGTFRQRYRAEAAKQGIKV